MTTDKFYEFIAELNALAEKYSIDLDPQLDKVSGSGQLIIYSNLQHQDFYDEDDDFGYELFDADV